MDFVNPINSRGKKPKEKSSILKRVAIWSASLFIGIILLVLALPTLLSNSTLLSWILAQVNPSLAPATVTVDNISLAWFQEQQIEGIHYKDPARGIEATVKKVTLSSLYDLLPIRKITANCTVDTPEIALFEPTVVLEPEQPTPGVPLPETITATTEPRQIILPAWDFAVNLTVKHGRLTHAAIPGDLLSGLACTLSIPEPTANPTFALNTAVPNGTLNINVQLNPIEKLLAAVAPADFFTSADLSLHAEWAKLSLCAAPLANHAYPGGTLTLNLTCDKLLKQLQALNIALPEEVETLTGSVSLSGTLEAAKAPNVLRLTTELLTQNLSGTIEGQQLTLSPGLNLIAELNPEAPLDGQIERLSLNFPGLIVSGSGSLKSGNLSAQADLNTLISTFRPFLGDFTLPVAATLTLSATATPETIKLNTAVKSGQNELATLRVNGEGVDLDRQSIRSLKTTLQADLNRLAPFLPLPKEQPLSGTIYLNTSVFGSLTDWQAKALLAIREFSFDSASWKVAEPSLLEGSVSCAFTEATGFAASNITLSAPFVTAIGSFAKQKLSLSGTLIPEKVLSYQKKPSGITLISEPEWQISATLGDPITVEAVVNANPFTVTLPEGFSIDVPLTVNVAATADAEAVNLSSYSLSTPYLTLTGSGNYALNAKSLSTSGSLTTNITNLWTLPVCDPYREAGFAISGNHTTPFFLELPLENGLPGILNYGKGEASIRFDTITIPGLDIPNGEMKVTLRDAVAALDGTFSVNNGTVSLQPRLLLAEQPIRLVIPDNTPLFKDISLTQKLFDAHLKQVNPLFTGVVKPGGTIELISNSCTLTLDDPINTLDANLTFKTHDCAFVPTGNLTILANLLRLSHRTVEIPNQNFNIAINQGNLTCDQIKLNIPPVHLRCSGKTNFKTGELSYLVQLPLTEQLLGSKVSKYLKVDQTLELPIAGTIHKPVLDTGPLIQILRDSAVSAGVNKLSSRMGKILKKSGEIGIEIGGAAGDTIETGEEIGADAVKNLGNVLDSLFKKKTK